MTLPPKSQSKPDSLNGLPFIFSIVGERHPDANAVGARPGRLILRLIIAGRRRAFWSLQR